MKLSDKSIYIGIASYRDPYLEQTLKEIYNKALYPERIKTHCFIQYLKEDKDCIPDLKRIELKDESIKSNITFDLQEAGEIFSLYESRNRSFSLLNSNYDYVLQIDAHNKFHPGWDVLLISMYEEIEDENVLISLKLPHWYIVNNEDILFDGPFKDLSTLVDWREDYSKKDYLQNRYWVGHNTYQNRKNNKIYERGWYTYGGFIFGKPNFFLIKRPDWFFVCGEEFLDSIRAFTGGWNVYSLRYVPIYHLYTGYENYTGIERRHIFDDFTEQCIKKDKNTFEEIRKLIINEEPDSINILRTREIKELYELLGYSIKDIITKWEEEDK